MVEVFYGVENGDGPKLLDPNTSQDGKVTLDKDFNLANPDAQAFFLETCEALNSEQKMVRSIVDCFMFQFRDYVVDRYSGGAFPNCDTVDGSKGIGFPVPADTFPDAMKCFHETSGYSESRNKYQLDESGNVEWATMRIWSSKQAGATVTEIEKTLICGQRVCKAKRLGKSAGMERPYSTTKMVALLHPRR